MLEIDNLHCKIDGKSILKGVNLKIKKGEIHSIMGPYGSGKSTLANVISGHEDYEVTKGSIYFDNNEIFLLGKLIINAKNIGDFYKSFQIKKNDRKRINQLELDFVYNFNKNKIMFDNVKIDKKSNEKIDQFIDEHNSNEDKFNNKVNFKNFVNNFFSNYAG